MSFKENNLKLEFYAYTIFLHFTILPIRKLPARQLNLPEIFAGFRLLMTSLTSQAVSPPLRTTGMNIAFSIYEAGRDFLPKYTQIHHKIVFIVLVKGSI
jgi:hypothetical protein